MTSESHYKVMQYKCSVNRISVSFAFISSCLPLFIHSANVHPNPIPCAAGSDGLNDEDTYASDSIAAILMMVLQYVQDRG